VKFSLVPRLCRRRENFDEDDTFFLQFIIVNALRNDMEFEQSWVKIPMYLNQELIGVHSAVVGKAKNKL